MPTMLRRSIAVIAWLWQPAIVLVRDPFVVAIVASALILLVGRVVWIARRAITLDSWLNVILLAIIPFAMGWAGVYLAAKLVESAAEKWLFIGIFTGLFIL